MTTYNPPRGTRADFDLVLIWCVLGLLAFGAVMVYSASIAAAEADRRTGYLSTYFFVRQACFVLVGLVTGAAAFRVPLASWQRLAPWLFLGGATALLLVLFRGIGHGVNGSQRWLSLGIVNAQPSEFMKLAVILYAADYTVRKAAFMHSLRRGFLPMFLVMFLVGVLLLREPDFGAFAVITLVTMSILFLGGLNWRLFVVLALMLLVCFLLLIVLSPYRLQRMIWFLHPWDDPLGKGYQLSHALIAFGRGQWLGVGLGASLEKQLYLPEAHTDFLLAVIAEELGYAGVLVTIALFAFVVWRAFAIGQRAAAMERYFAALTAQGIGVWLAIQTGVNMGVNMGILPTKGLTLPLLSYGGSGIVANCIAVAILLRIDFECRQLMRGRAG